ncbi:MAG: CvpA family protein [Clostridia bacterium]|nr:CvpA family protein [Clostridia bacterium]
MGIIIDLIIIAIIISSTILGYKKGLVKVAVKLFAVIIAIIVTLILYKPVSNLIIKNTEIDENIQKVIIENGKTEKQEQNDEEKASFMTYIEKYVQDSVTDAKNEAVESVAVVVSEKLINIMVIVGLFILTRLVLILLTLVSDVITKMPIIKQFNKAGGIVYGLLKGLIIVYIVLAVAFFAMSISANQTLTDIINSSILTKAMYSNNILLNIIF